MVMSIIIMNYMIENYQNEFSKRISVLHSTVFTLPVHKVWCTGWPLVTTKDLIKFMYINVFISNLL